MSDNCAIFPQICDLIGKMRISAESQRFHEGSGFESSRHRWNLRTSLLLKKRGGVIAYYTDSVEYPKD